MSDKFERKLNSPFFKYSKRMFDLILVNMLFLVVSALSALVLFVPGLVSLHTITYRMVNNIDDRNVFYVFFKEIKEQWSFSWRLEVLTMVVLALTGVLFYFDITYLLNTGIDVFVILSMAFVGAFLIVLISIFINLMVFNNYIKDDTFWMMIKKSSLIARKHFKLTFLNMLIFAAFVTLGVFLTYITPFISFSIFIYIVEAMSRKTFTQIALEEEERAAMDENLFLPAVVPEEKLEAEKQEKIEEK